MAGEIRKEVRVVKRRVMFAFSPEVITEPIIYSLGQQFRLKTNIRRADLAEGMGWIVLELDGEEGDIENGIAWVTSRGVRVAPVGDETGGA